MRPLNRNRSFRMVSICLASATSNRRIRKIWRRHEDAAEHDPCGFDACPSDVTFTTSVNDWQARCISAGEQ